MCNQTKSLIFFNHSGSIRKAKKFISSIFCFCFSTVLHACHKIHGSKTDDSFQDISHTESSRDRSDVLDKSFEDSTDAYSEGWFQNQNGSMVVRGTAIIPPPEMGVADSPCEEEEYNSNPSSVEESSEPDQEEVAEEGSAWSSTWGMPIEGDMCGVRVFLTAVVHLC